LRHEDQLFPTVADGIHDHLDVRVEPNLLIAGKIHRHHRVATRFELGCHQVPVRAVPASAMDAHEGRHT
jgi:hypothetical protein